MDLPHICEVSMAEYGKRPCPVCQKPVTTNALGRGSHMDMHNRNELASVVREMGIEPGVVLSYRDHDYVVESVQSGNVRTVPDGSPTARRFFRAKDLRRASVTRPYWLDSNTERVRCK